MDTQQIADLLHDEVLVNLQAVQERDEGNADLGKAIQATRKAIDALVPAVGPAMTPRERAAARIAPPPPVASPQGPRRLGRNIDSSVLANISQEERNKFGLMGADA